MELLTAQDEARAAEIAEVLNEENTLRQKISREIFMDAEKMLAQYEHIDTAIGTQALSALWHRAWWISTICR